MSRNRNHLRRLSGMPARAADDDISVGQVMALLMRLLNIATPFVLAKEGTGQSSG
ncbi:MAG: hypothetical protein GXY15_08000 [Candidatus Hydrogenedentes bacterium]|nr:hypothetical protein [Candidatus Hydrogenedentota bacterium]